MRLRILAAAIAAIFLAAPAPHAAPAHTWSHSYGNEELQTLKGLAVDPFGNILICGTFYGSITFAATHNSAGGSDLFLAKLDPAGNPLWSKRIGGFFNEEGNDVASDPVGNVIVVGKVFSNGPTIIVAKYAADGTSRWTKFLEGGPAGGADRVTTNGAKEIIFSGQLGGQLVFAADTLNGYGDGIPLLAKYDQNGVPVWGRVFEEGALQNGHFLAGLSPNTWRGLDADIFGQITMFGDFANTLIIEPDTLTSSGASDLYLTKFNNNGDRLWIHTYGGASQDEAAGSALSLNGRIAILSNQTTPIDFGGGVLTPTGSSSPCLAVFTPNGTHLWSKSLDSSTFGYGLSLAFAENSDLLVSCWGQGTINFGGGPVASGNVSHNTFVARLFQNTGGHRWSTSYVGSGNLYGLVDESNYGIVLAGSMEETVNFGGGALPYNGESDVYAARFGDVLTGVRNQPIAGYLQQNTPNPFNPQTTIRYTLESPGDVVIGIYNVAGEAVRRIEQPASNAGAHSVVWNGRDDAGHAVASGVYMYRLEGAPGIAARKMVLLK